MSRLESGPPFAFVRFGDGEDAIIRGRYHLAKSDGWKWPQGGLGADSRLPELLHSSLVERCGDPDWFWGISAAKHHPKSHEFYSMELRLRKADFGRVTFAEIFNFSNYSRFHRWMKHHGGLSRDKYAICGPESGVTYQVPFDAMKRLAGNAGELSADLTERIAEEMIVDSFAGSRLPIFVAAGPLANLIVHHYWKNCNPKYRRTIIDVGSVIAEFLHGRRNRVHQNPKCSKHLWQPQFWPDP